jgi:hypothetical protein
MGKVPMVLANRGDAPVSSIFVGPFDAPVRKGWNTVMTPQQAIDRIVSFEKDLAGFYEDLQLKASLKPLEKICRFMAQHSAIHAEMIANY